MSTLVQMGLSSKAQPWATPTFDYQWLAALAGLRCGGVCRRQPQWLWSAAGKCSGKRFIVGFHQTGSPQGLWLCFSTALPQG